jgi:prepilin signal peptidase PulO-like enzyme (type II secretory pathway)
MEPFVWPFFVMGSILIAGALLENVRPFVSGAAVLLGAISMILFLGTLVAGRKALYELWFPDQLGPAGMLEFHFWLLAVHFAAMLAMLFGGMAEVGRRWRMDHLASQPT